MFILSLPEAPSPAGTKRRAYLICPSDFSKEYRYSQKSLARPTFSTGMFSSGRCSGLGTARSGPPHGARFASKLTASIPAAKSAESVHLCSSCAFQLDNLCSLPSNLRLRWLYVALSDVMPRAEVTPEPSKFCCDCESNVWARDSALQEWVLDGTRSMAIPSLIPENGFFDRHGNRAARRDSSYRAPVTFGRERKRTLSQRRLQDCFVFSSSSVSAGTISKRSPTMP
jgi:hypothetical protein